MAEAASLDWTRLRRPLVLPADATLTPVAQLDASVRERLGAEPGDVALTRASTRRPTSVIDADLARLLEGFRRPTTIAHAVARFCRDSGDDAEAVLEKVLPLLRDLVVSAVLLPADAEAMWAPPLACGDRFGPFEVVRSLQLLDDSEVCQARGPDGFAALKVARAGSAIAGRLEREAAVLRRLDGEVTAPLLAAGTEGDRPFLAQAWLAGTDLAAVAAEHRRASDFVELLKLLVELVRAYARLHARGVLHGDVHGRNALVDADGAVRLLDFGLAAPIGAAEPRAERGGVAFFYEPEFAHAALEGDPAPPSTPAGEQFAVAALLYTLATGEHYDDFELEQTAMFRAIATARPKPFVERGVPPWPTLERCLARALAPKPEERFADMAAFAEAVGVCDPAEPAASRRARPVATTSRSAARRRFVEDVVRELDVEGPLFAGGVGRGPLASLGAGAAGVAYALYRLACGRDDPRLLALADAWVMRAQHDREEPAAFVDPELPTAADTIGPASVPHGPAGVSFIATLIASAMGDAETAERESRRYLRDIDTACVPWDATLGRCSAVLASAMLASGLGEELADARAAVVATGRRLLAGLWAEVEDLAPIGDAPSRANLGVAHGWAGLLLATLRWREATADPLPPPFASRTRELWAQAHPVGRGLAVPWHVGDGTVAPSMAGWCNGSAGLVHLGCAVHEATRAPEWLAFAEGMAWHAFEGPEGPVDLCCGSAGRIYALVAYHRATGESAWLERARAMADRAVDTTPFRRGEEYAPHRLLKGDVGLMLALDEMERPATASMPLTGLDR